jgi:type II restriction/modification system DNA methylase subunit YeeA
MIDFNEGYDRDNALNFLRDNLLPEDLQILEEDIPIQQSSGKLTEKAVLLGIAPSLDLNVYEFTHKSESDPRVTITKEAFRFLANRGEQRALAFFVSKNSPNYRFSLITIDLKPSGKKVEKIISNPKRYSYYLGPDAKINTPTKYLISKGRIIDFEDLKSRFSIEVVNKEFFKQISKYFMILAGGKWEKEDFGLGKLILPSTVEHQKKQEFTVRLIGRIIFCWFLKKKNSIQGKPLMPKELLSANLIEKNYYHNVLEPLFFEVLNRQKEQRDKKFRTELFDTIPFLNGGLFEPHDDDFYAVDSELKFSKYFNNLTIPDDWFEGLFGVLETYNFTIDENTSSDIDLSVDPEMLGRIFENLLAEINPETGETARKSTGSYYTPRAIVDYMVNQSIKYYLLEKTKIDEDRIDKLVNNTFDNVELSKDEQREIIDAFSSLKVIDPACGSGAFPMGVLQKVVSILSEVDPESQLWLDKQLEKIDDSILKRKFEQSLSGGTVSYVHKLGLIKNSIYGVDIQEIAVELSKLRVFLSLVVDAKVDDSEYNRGVEPLPNLEFKFVCANSLIDLPAEKFYLVDKKTGNIGTLHNELKKLREDYFNSYGDDKERIKEEFKEKQKQLFNVFLEWGSDKGDQKSLMLSEWDPFSNKPSSWFNPEWMFGVSDGFDIVIANPPYIRQEAIKNQKESLQKQGYKVYNSGSDIYTYFYEKGYDLLRDNGILVFISSNKWMRAKYGEKLRKFIKENTEILELIDFGGYKVFDATVDTNILIFKALKHEGKNFKKVPGKNEILYGENTFIGISVKEDFDRSGGIYSYVKNNSIGLKQHELDERTFLIADNSVLSLKEKIEKIGKPLKAWDVKIYRGVLTGFNEAFIITTEKRNEILSNCKTNDERKRTEEVIKPILRGRDIGKYYYKWAGLWLIKIESGWTNKNCGSEDPETYFCNAYYSIYKYLKDIGDKIEQNIIKVKGKGLYNRDDQGDYWWELRYCDYYPEFEKEKIVWQEIVREPSFAYDINKMYCEATSFLMTGKNLKYLIAVLNSNSASFFFKKFYAGGGLGEEGYRYKKAFLEQLTIPKIPESDQQPFINLVDKILEITKDEDYPMNPQKQAKVKEYEYQIDKLVYKLYNLTTDEIKIIDRKD